MNDPIVNEIRKFRDEHSKEYNYDIKAICNDFRKKHNLYLEKLAQMKGDQKIDNSLKRSTTATLSNALTSQVGNRLIKLIFRAKIRW